MTVLNFLTYVPMADDLVSINTFSLATATNNRIDIYNLQGSYNGYLVTPSSIEIDTSGNNSPLQLTLDAFNFWIEPGSYFVRDITNVNSISLTGQENYSVNFYKNQRKEILETNISQYYYVRRVYYKSWGDTTQLKMNWNGTTWVWDTTNAAPFNVVQDVAIPVLLLPAEPNTRLHIGIFAAIAPALASGNQYLSFQIGSSPTIDATFIPLPYNSLYWNAPLLLGPIYFALVGPFTAPTLTAQSPGYITLESYYRS
jgi:hypothetical protein